MRKFLCPFAVLKNAFPNLLCQKKMEKNGTKLQNTNECFEAQCDCQDFCECRRQPQNDEHYLSCKILAEARKDAGENKSASEGKYEREEAADFEEVTAENANELFENKEEAETSAEKPAKKTRKAKK